MSMLVLWQYTAKRTRVGVAPRKRSNKSPRKIQRTAVSCWSRPTATSFKIHWSELQTLLCGTRSDTGQNLASRLRVAPASVSCPPSRLTQRTNTLISSPLKTKTPPDVDPFVRKLTLGEISKVIPLPVQIASGPSYRFNLAGGSEAYPMGHTIS